MSKFIYLKLLFMVILLPSSQAFGQDDGGRIELKTINEKLDEFTIAWRCCSEDSAKVDFFRLELAKDPTFKSKVDGYEDLNTGKDTIFTFENLEGGHTYYYRIYAYADQNDKFLYSHHGFYRGCGNFINVRIEYTNEKGEEQLFQIVERNLRNSNNVQMDPNIDILKLLVEAYSVKKEPIEYAYRITPDIIKEWQNEKELTKLMLVHMNEQDYTIDFRLKNHKGEWVTPPGVLINAYSAKRKLWVMVSVITFIFFVCSAGLFYYRKRVMMAFLKLVLKKVHIVEESKLDRKICLTAKLKVELLDLFEEQHVYLDANLSLKIVSSHLGISEQALSGLVNDHFQTSFNDFVNGYRIREFKRMMESSKAKDFTILAVAQECGYNSKSSFNRAFKKFIGTTPSEYLKSLQCLKA